MAGTELATAWVRLVPSVSDGGAGGLQSQLVKEFGGDAEKAGEQSGSRFGAGLKKGVGGVAIGAAAIGAAKGLFDLGSEFNQMSRDIRAGTGATGEALDELMGVAKDVASTVPTDLGAAATAVADIDTLMGLSGETMAKVASQFLEAGRVFGEDVSIETAAHAFNAFGLQGDEVSAALDHLFQVSQATGVGMNSLAQSVQNAAPAAQKLGLSFDEVAVMVGELEKAGLNGSKMAEQMGRRLVDLAEEGEK